MDQPQASTPKPKKGLKKVWAKVKASLRSGSSKKPTEASGQPTTLATSAQEPQRVPTEQPAPTTEPTKSTETPALPTTIPETDQPTQKAGESERKPLQLSGIIEVDDGEEQETIVLPHRYIAAGSASAKARFDRARAVFEKYNMTLEPSDWLSQSKPHVQRVEKKPRMRVRWTCHQCKATFGRAKLCPQCSHPRCSECVRYPPKRIGERSKKESSKVEAPTAVTEVPTVGACHECKTEFTIGAPECGNCNHKICERCLKETILASPSTAPPPATADLVAAAL